jgi:ribonucleoside-diphosphate reductase alpha chain
MENRQPFDWINEESITFLRRGYLSAGEEPLERIKIIAEHAEKLLGMDGLAEK